VYMNAVSPRDVDAAASVKPPQTDLIPPNVPGAVARRDARDSVSASTRLAWRFLFALARFVTLLAAIFCSWAALTQFLGNIYAPIACANSGMDPRLYCRELGLWMLTGEAHMAADLSIFGLFILVRRRSLLVRVLSFAALCQISIWLDDKVGDTYDYLWPLIFSRR